MHSFLDILLAHRFWRWYNRIESDLKRFGLCMLIVLPPIYTLNGAFHIRNKYVQISAGVYLMYIFLSCIWKELRRSRG